MSIVFDENLDLFCLETANTSYIIGLADHRTFVGHVYYGRRVRRQDLRYLLRTGEAPFVPSGNERECCSFYDTFPAEYSGNGVGDYRESSIAVRTQAGQHAVMPTYVSYEITDQKPELPGLPSAFDREHTAQEWEITGKAVLPCVHRQVSMRLCRRMFPMKLQIRNQNFRDFRPHLTGSILHRH